MSTPISLPFTPPQPPNARYSILLLSNYHLFSRESYQAAYGVEPPAYDPTKRDKVWFDSSVDLSDPTAEATFMAHRPKPDGSWKYELIAMPVTEAATPNIPPSDTKMVNAPSTLKPWDIPSRALLANERYDPTPFGLEVENTDIVNAQPSTSGGGLTTQEHKWLSDLWTKLVGTAPLVIAVLLLATGMKAQSSLSLLAPATSTAPGGTTVVQVSLAVPAGTASPVALQFDLGTTKDVTNVAIAAGASSTAANKTVGCGATVNNVTPCIIYGMNTTTIPNGVVAQFTLTLSSATTLTTEPLTLTSTEGADASDLVLAVTGNGATVPVVLPPSPCDLNQDGIINLADAVVALSQVYSFLANGTGCTTADINKDGKCDIIDIGRIVAAAQPGGVCRVN